MTVSIIGNKLFVEDTYESESFFVGFLDGYINKQKVVNCNAQEVNISSVLIHVFL